MIHTQGVAEVCSWCLGIWGRGQSDEMLTGQGRIVYTIHGSSLNGSPGHCPDG